MNFLGMQSLTIEFKPGHQQDFYSFLSNISHRELLLHDLLAQDLDVSFSDMTSAQGHSCIPPLPPINFISKIDFSRAWFDSFEIY